MKTKLFILLFLTSFLGWSQTTVTYNFSDSGAVTGLDEGTPGISLDANIGFGSFKNSASTNPGIYSGQLRLYQNSTKGGSIKIYASNGVTITKVVIYASGTTGPAAFAVDGGSSSAISISSGTYSMDLLTGTDNVEFWCTGSSSGTRVYVDSFEVTYTGASANPEPDNHLTSLTANNITYNSADLSWTDATGTNLPLGYYILVNTTGTFTAPVDGTPLTEDLDFSDGEAIINVLYGDESYSLSGLDPETTYYVEVYPYSNTNADIDYKTDGTIPSTNFTTIAAPNFCAFEDFTNSNLTTGYTNNSFVGNNGVTWTYVASRDQNNDANGSGINGNAIMLRRVVDNSKITSSTVTGGIKNFSVKLYKGFTGAGNRQVELFINGTSYGTSPAFDDYDEHIFEVNNIDIGGDVIVELRNITSSQIIVDDIAWGCYTAPIITTWNGSAWDNGVPDNTMEAHIEGDYTTSTDGNISAFQLVINTGGTLTINSGGVVSVEEEITNNLTAADFVVESGGTLVQVQNVANSGDITVNRDSTPMIRLDYTGWSSPVVGQNLLAFSPNTVTSRFYTYNENGTDIASAWSSVDPSATDFASAIGYLIRVDNTWSATVPAVYNGVFTGVPNNGDYTASVVFTTGAPQPGFNLVGNPYPSTIDADTFITDNAAVGADALHFWSHATAADGSGNYTSNNYASYTSGGGGVASAGGGAAPDGTIQIGQGFMVHVASSGDVAFNNGQRLTTNGGQFFKTTSSVERHRVWLNLSDANTNYNQMMFGYITDATMDNDSGIDAKLFSTSSTNLYSLVNNEEFVIQGRSLPFDATDEVPLGFTTDIAGTYIISIDHVDGLFDNQDIYLWDKDLNVYHDLNVSDYSFASAQGTFNNRFSVVYSTALKANTVEQTNAIVYVSNNEIIINSGTSVMNTVNVYDIQGRLLVTKAGINTSDVTISGVTATNQVLLVEIFTTNGKTTKKVKF